MRRVIPLEMNSWVKHGRNLTGISVERRRILLVRPLEMAANSTMMDPDHPNFPTCKGSQPTEPIRGRHPHGDIFRPTKSVNRIRQRFVTLDPRSASLQPYKVQQLRAAARGQMAPPTKITVQLYNGW
jgi:hypothetical protein